MWCAGVIHKVYADMHVLLFTHGGQRTVLHVLACHFLAIEIESCIESEIRLAPREPHQASCVLLLPASPVISVLQVNTRSPSTIYIRSWDLDSDTYDFTKSDYLVTITPILKVFLMILFRLVRGGGNIIRILAKYGLNFLPVLSQKKIQHLGGSFFLKTSITPVTLELDHFYIDRVILIHKITS